ncbi:sugar transferase [Clostridiaceae bacterium]|nr:sugar transferase [Clostridiaceae bacterium]
MRNQEQFKRLIRAAFCFILLLLHAGIFWYVWKRFYSPLMEIQYWMRGHLMILAFYLFWAFLLPRIYGGWRVGYLKIFYIVYSQSLGIAMADMLIYCLIVLLTKHIVNPGPLFLMYMLQLISALLWGAACTKIYIYIYPPRTVLLVYGGRLARGLMKKISTRSDRFVVGETIHISEGIDTVKEKIKNYQGVVICDIASQERNAVLKYCYGKGIRSYTTPKISDLIIRSAESQHMFDTPLLLSRNTGLTIEQRFVKRLMDIALSGLALIPSLPVMGIVALCIKLEDGGSIIYKQKRLTMGGEFFFVYKFRSMREDAEKDGVARLAGEKDERITKTGKVIRAVRLDELPQLFNIIKGDMSIVGPRPERPEIAAEYETEIPEFVYRLKVKAGLTGYAQVYGKYNTTAYDKLKLDLMYIQNYSLRLDFEIMFRTVQILFMKESTEGMAEGQFIARSEEEPVKRAVTPYGKET